MSHPPRNRVDSPLPAQRVEIEDRQGRVTRPVAWTPCRSRQRGTTAASNRWTSGSRRAASALCGEPGFLYRAGGLQIPLTRNELLRLIFGALTADEFFKLREM